MVPLEAIQNAIEKLKEGTIQDYRHDPNSARIVREATSPSSPP
jgi:hypothetical protein